MLRLLIRIDNSTACPGKGKASDPGGRFLTADETDKTANS